MCLRAHDRRVPCQLGLLLVDELQSRPADPSERWWPFARRRRTSSLAPPTTTPLPTGRPQQMSSSLIIRAKKALEGQIVSRGRPQSVAPPRSLTFSSPAEQDFKGQTTAERVAQLGLVLSAVHRPGISSPATDLPETD
jgi:hypothetical protein